MRTATNRLLPCLANLLQVLIVGMLLSACGGASDSPGSSLASAKGTTATESMNTIASTSEFVTGTTIEDFNDPATIERWKFYNGKEFPGADGSIALGEGYEGTGLKLNYDFQCIPANSGTSCGRYVVATYTPSQPIWPGSAIRIMVRSPADIRIALRVFDESGQVLQYWLERPLEARDVNDWHSLTAPLQHPALYWNGANNGVLQGQIKSIQILANVHSGLHPVSGTVDIDDVSMLDSADAQHTLDLASAALTPIPSGAATLGPRIGVAYHFPQHKVDALDNAHAAGISFVRTDMWWTNVEKNNALGRYDFSHYDQLVAELEKRGMGALFIIATMYAPSAYDILTPEGVAAYARFAKAAAEHYAWRNVRFEIANEPNHPTFWKGTPEQYFDLCRAGIDAIHEGNPSAQVSTGGLAGFDVEYLKKELSSGAADRANGIGIHPYRSSAPETLVSTMLLGEHLVQKITGKDIPVWNTEWGYSLSQMGGGDGHSDAFRHRQAVLLARAMLSQWTLGSPMAVWYDLVDDGINPAENEHNFGLLDANYNEKPAMRALREFAAWAKRRTNNGLMRNLPSGLHIMKLEGAGDVVFVAWNSEPNAKVQLRIPSAGSPSAVNLLGLPLSGLPDSSSESSYLVFTLSESDGPIYIRYPKGS